MESYSMFPFEMLFSLTLMPLIFIHVAVSVVHSIFFYLELAVYISFLSTTR